MSNLLQQVRRMGLALAVALGLTLLAAVATPLLGDDLPTWVPNVAQALAETKGSGG